MAIKKVKSFAEYAVRQWLAERGMSEKDFSVEMDGRVALVTDANGDTTTLEYDSRQRIVYDTCE